jgi:hypothetical protein
VVSPQWFFSINVKSGFSWLLLLYQCDEWFLLSGFSSINVKSGFSWVVSPEWFLLSGFS